MNISIHDPITKLPGRALLLVLATSLQSPAAPQVTEHGPFGEAGGLTNAEVIDIYPVGIGDVLELPSTTRS